MDTSDLLFLDAAIKEKTQATARKMLQICEDDGLSFSETDIALSYLKLLFNQAQEELFYSTALRESHKAASIALFK